MGYFSAKILEMTRSTGEVQRRRRGVGRRGWSAAPAGCSEGRGRGSCRSYGRRVFPPPLWIHGDGGGSLRPSTRRQRPRCCSAGKGRVKAIFLDRFRGKTDANFGSPAVVTDVPLRIRQPVCRQPDVCRRNGNVTRKWIWSHQTPVRA